MNYSFFLFSKLYDVFVGVDYEYDIFFENLQGLYNDYDTSKYNNPNKGEYECMVDFFNENRSQILSEFLKNKNDL